MARGRAQVPLMNIVLCLWVLLLLFVTKKA
jgi:hypothetical protein